MTGIKENTEKINIIGAGLAGLSAARILAEMGIPVRLVSVQQSERAQSNLAEGGINAALNVMGENDTVGEHFQDTMAGGCKLADPNMVAGLTRAAPDLVRDLDGLGVPFHREKGKLIQRNFGGQKKKRTSYAKSSTGKVLMAAMIDQVRRYEAEGLVDRYCHHRFERLVLEEGVCQGAEITDIYSKKIVYFPGKVIMACGGMNGMFPGLTTGTTADTGTASARLFCQGVCFANLEFLQYHPTTVEISGKRLLVSEAARGEGGRLFYEKEDGSPCYFMEEKYGQRGNLMPRDVISREMALLGRQAYLDLRDLPKETWDHKLSDLREEIIHYLGIDPTIAAIPVSPGIHYFMGGIFVDEDHRTNIPGLYAAGECACAYHGANRLGGNSLLGAVYGGRKAAQCAGEEYLKQDHEGYNQQNLTEITEPDLKREEELSIKDLALEEKMARTLASAMGILREKSQLDDALKIISRLQKQAVSEETRARLLLARAMLLSALERKESRGAHTRLDYPETDEDFRRTTRVACHGETISIDFQEIPDLRPEIS